MKAKAFCVITVALMANLMGTETVCGDESAPSVFPGTVVQANPLSPAQESPAPAAKLTLRDKLFHWPAIIHSKPACQDCGLTDPDFCCSTCRSQWIFLFGSCHAFYGESRTWK